MENRANLFLAGAMKAGTTSLSKLFDRHPDIFVCPIKEPNFFVSELPAQISNDDSYESIEESPVGLNANSNRHFAHVKTLNQYHSLFKLSDNEKYLADCSTIYLHSKEAAQKIKEYNSSSKIIIIIRDPVKRAFSQYKMDYAKGRTNKTFEEQWLISKNQHHNCWSYYHMSLYADAIKNYQQLFGSQNVLILVLEELIVNSAPVLKSLENFLGISFKNIELTSENESIKPVFPVINTIMYKYKVKSIIRRLIPDFFIEKGKKIFYTYNNLKLDDKTYNSLIPLFEEDIKACEKLLSRSLNYQKKLSHRKIY